MPDPASAKSPSIEDILKANNANDDELDRASTVSAPDGTPLIAIKQLGASEEIAKATIATISTREPIVTALLAAWRKETGTPVGPSPTPPAVAALTAKDPPPAGSVDVTTGDWPILTAHRESETIRFTIPDVLRNTTPGARAVSFDTLQWTDWLHVARLCNLTKAIKLDAVFGSSGSILPAGAALEWRPKPEAGFVDGVTPQDIANGGLTTQICFTKEEHAAFSQGFVSTSLEGHYGLVSGSASVTHKSRLITNTAHRRVYMGYKDTHPVCRLHLTRCLTASPLFIDAMQAAVKNAPADTFGRILTVLEEFGHATPQSVVLGGFFLFENTRDVKSWDRKNESELKSRLETNFGTAAPKANAEAASGSGSPGWNVGVGATYDDEAKDWFFAERLTERMRAYPVGGDMNLRNPETWSKTIVNVDDWRVILREGKLTSVLTYLPDALRQQVVDCWEAGRKHAWGLDQPRTVNKLPNELDFPTPLFWTLQGIQPVTMLHKQAKQVLQAANGVTDRLEPHPDHVIAPEARGEMSLGEQRFGIGPAEPPGGGRVAGSHWMHCDPAPLLLDHAAATDAAANRALWRFEFTGDVTRDGEPLYWIVAQDNAWLLAAFKDTGRNSFWANLLPGDHRTTLPGSSTAAWCIFPADPTGLRGDDYARSFLIWNPVYNVFLAAPVKFTSDKAWVEPEHDEHHINYQPYPMSRYGYYYDSTYHTPMKAWSDGDVEMTRAGLRYAKDGIAEVYDAEDFSSLCWDIRPYDAGR